MYLLVMRVCLRPLGNQLLLRAVSIVKYMCWFDIGFWISSKYCVLESRLMTSQSVLFCNKVKRSFCFSFIDSCIGRHRDKRKNEGRWHSLRKRNIVADLRTVNMEFSCNYYNENKQEKLDKIYCIVFYCGYLYYVLTRATQLQRRLLIFRVRLFSKSAVNCNFCFHYPLLSTPIARNLVIARVFKCIYAAFGLESEISFYPFIKSLEKQLRNRSSSA